jgi:hypothetical protein
MLRPLIKRNDYFVVDAVNLLLVVALAKMAEQGLLAHVVHLQSNQVVDVVYRYIVQFEVSFEIEIDIAVVEQDYRDHRCLELLQIRQVFRIDDLMLVTLRN